MRVAVIASSTHEMLSLCFTAISKFLSEGHEVHAIIVNGSTLSESPRRQSDDWAPRDTTSFHINLVNDFDYSSITQANADKIQSHIKSIKPQVVIMPYWKSRDHDQLTLARSSLIACRGIGNILMYMTQSELNFNPSIIFPKKDQSSKDSNMAGQEMYESHRLLLLDEVEML